MEYQNNSPFAPERCDYYSVEEMYPTIYFGGSFSYVGWNVTENNFEKAYSSISEVESPLSINLTLSNVGENQFRLDADFIATANITSSQNKVLFIITATSQPSDPSNSDWKNKPVAVSEAIDLNIDFGQTISLSHNFDVDTVINSELKGIVIVQSWNSKKIVQSAIVDLGNTGNLSNNEIFIPIIKNYPNPFILGDNSRFGGITILFSSPKNSEGRVDIFNIKGQKIINLYDGNFSKGENKFLWKGKDKNNNLVPSGVYFYKITTSEKSYLRKILIVK